MRRLLAGVGRATMGAVRMAANVVYSETAMRKTAQGAAEISQALYSQSNAYVPYGQGQHSISVDGPQMSHQDRLRSAAQRAGQSHSHGMER